MENAPACTDDELSSIIIHEKPHSTLQSEISQSCTYPCLNNEGIIKMKTDSIQITVEEPIAFPSEENLVKVEILSETANNLTNNEFNVVKKLGIIHSDLIAKQPEQKLSNETDFVCNGTPQNDNLLQILDDYIRFDVTRTGALCCSGYLVSVQYEDKFLVGRRISQPTLNKWTSSKRSRFTANVKNANSTPYGWTERIKGLCPFRPRRKTFIDLTSMKELVVSSDGNVDLDIEKVDQSVLQIQFITSSICYCFPCFKSEQRNFDVDIPTTWASASPLPKKTNEGSPRPAINITRSLNHLGTVHNRLGTLVKVSNKVDNCEYNFKPVRGGGTNTDGYLIVNQADEKIASIEVFRGLRGSICSYGLTIIDNDLSPGAKGLLISSVLTMDLCEQESETICTCLWTPLFTIMAILLFTLVPWIYSHSKA